MNHEQEINQLAEVIKADKRIIQPWRNYALKHLAEAQAHIRMGLSTTTRLDPARPTLDSLESFGGSKVDDDAPHPRYDLQEPNVAQCNCPAGGFRRSCPVHGSGA